MNISGSEFLFLSRFPWFDLFPPSASLPCFASLYVYFCIFRRWSSLPSASISSIEVDNIGSAKA